MGFLAPAPGYEAAASISFPPSPRYGERGPASNSFPPSPRFGERGTGGEGSSGAGPQVQSTADIPSPPGPLSPKRGQGETIDEVPHPAPHSPSPMIAVWKSVANTPRLFASCLLCLPAALASADDRYAAVTDFEQLKQLAAEVAAAPFVPRQPLADDLAALDYEAYRDIQFDHRRAIWRDSDPPFWIEMFHRGFVQNNRIELLTIEPTAVAADSDQPTGGGRVVRPVPYRPEFFRFGPAARGIVASPQTGYAGLRIAGQLHPDGAAEEILTFLGSSYFRGRCAESGYGSSVRGLAVDIALPGPEEFPFYRAMWVVRPTPGVWAVEVLALLDSPSVAGAYRFTLEPWVARSKVHVEAELTFRNTPQKVGIAPITSMWMWGDGLDGPPKDDRPSVHDADGLSIHDADGWRWRVPGRQPYPSVSTFEVNDLKGFGMVQRDRNHAHYLDDGAMYDRRPSVWIDLPAKTARSPLLTDGRLELLELPGAHEGIDNLGVYFVPAELPPPGVPTPFEYTISFLTEAVDPSLEYRSLAKVNGLDVRWPDDGTITLDVRFAGPSLAKRSGESLTAAVMTVRGAADVPATLTRRYKDEITVPITLRPTEDGPVEVRCVLRDGGEAVSEEFVYLCPRRQPTFVYPDVYTRQESAAVSPSLTP